MSEEGQIQWVPVDKIRPGPRLRDHLIPELDARARVVHERIGKFFCKGQGKWLDGFCHDIHPEREIGWWERLADFYHEYLREHPEYQSKAALRQLAHMVFRAAMER